MKSKKLAMALTALTLSSASAFAFAACSNGNNGGNNGEHTEHEYTWTVETPATCTTDGVEKGTCSCGDTTTRPIPSSNGHKYGDWQITAMPSKDGKGEAVKVCANDTAHDHDIKVELPAFDRAGKGEYSSFKEEGHFVSFTYAHESGDITAKVVASVKDAIELGVENKEAVVSGTAGVYHDYKIYNTKASGDITYEFGENNKYLHVNDPTIDKREYFYTLNEDGTMFPVYLEWKSISKDGQSEGSTTHITTSYRETLNNKNATPEMMQGFGFFFVWLNGDHKEYGIENFINYIYNEYYLVNTNGDAKASIEVDNKGTTVYKFNVSVHSVLNIDLLNKIEVSFTLDENNVLKTASVSNRTWNNPVLDTATNLWSVPAGSDYVVMDQYNITQETEREAGAEIPTNPYNLEDMLITSYDMVLDGETVKEGQTLEIDANEVTIITLENIQPAETFNLNFDEMTVTLTDSEGKIKDCVPSATDLADGEILAQIIPLRSYDGETITVVNTLQIKSLLAGEFTLTIKSAKLTKTIKLKVNTVAPSVFGATVYEYDPFKSAWNIDDYNTEFTVYEGQGLNLTSYVAHPLYEETGFTLAVSRGEDVGFENDYTISDNVVEGTGVKKFVANVAGDYTVTLTNLKKIEVLVEDESGQKVVLKDITAQIIVHVIEAPKMEDVLKGKYFNLDEAVELTFTPTAEGATSGTATLVTGVGGKRPQTTELTYSYTEGVGVTLEYVSGAEYDGEFKLVFDDAYNMTVSYKTTAGTIRAVYIYNVVPNLIEGTYRITTASSSAVKLVVNIEGKYSITANSYSGVYYGIYDVKTDRQIGDNHSLSANTVVDLQVGQYIKVWCIGQQTGDDGNIEESSPTEYTVTFIPEEEVDAQ